MNELSNSSSLNYANSATAPHLLRGKVLTIVALFVSLKGLLWSGLFFLDIWGMHSGFTGLLLAMAVGTAVVCSVILIVSYKAGYHRPLFWVVTGLVGISICVTAGALLLSFL